MIRPARSQSHEAVGRHYDELDPFYRSLWGEHLHHGLWTTGRESAEAAALAMVDAVADRAGIGPGSEVCDVGSGYGAVARELARRGAHVTGLTVSRVQFRHAVASVAGPAMNGGGHGGPGSPSPRFLLRDWLENGLDSESFDTVIAIESLSHMRDPGAAIAEAYRVLRPGGRLVACVWLAAPDPTPAEVRHILRPICKEGRLPGLPDPRDHGRWLAEAGFRDVRLEDVSARVARTWDISARRLGLALLRPASWRYLLDGRNSERAFALSVLRLLVGFRTGAVRYGILTGRRAEG